MVQKIMDQLQQGFCINTKAGDDCNQIHSVIIKVLQFEWKKNTDDDWYSHAFFIHKKGYKIKLNIVPAGCMDD